MSQLPPRTGIVLYYSRPPRSASNVNQDDEESQVVGSNDFQ
jgi:hypothetical protein